MEPKRNVRSKKSVSQGKVYFIGAGPGDPKLLTIRGREILAAADLIVYAGSLVNPEILSYAKHGARAIDSARLTLAEITSAMVTAAARGATVARLHTGDPAVFGAIEEQMEIIRRQGIDYAIIPGVSSAFAAAAALRKELTIPGVSQTLILTRRGGKTPVPERESLALLAAHQASLVVFLSIGMLDQTVKELIAGGYAAATPAAVVYRASWPNETVIKGTLATIAGEVKRLKITRQALIIVGKALDNQKGERSRLYSPKFSHGFRTARAAKQDGPAVVAITDKGAATGRLLVNKIQTACLFLPERLQSRNQQARIEFYKDLGSLTAALFQHYRKVVFIMAAGIAVRMTAPLVKSKWEDPAVVVMDDNGKNIISLLAGHWGGANQLAVKIAKLTGGNSVITTASDVRGLPSLSLVIKWLGSEGFSRETLKKIEAAMVAGRSVGFYPRELAFFPGMEGHENLCFFDSLKELLCSGCKAGLALTHKPPRDTKKSTAFLFIRPRDLVVGIGCRKGVLVPEIERAIKNVLQNNKLTVASIRYLCSIEAKRAETGFIAYANAKNIPLQFFTASELNNVAMQSPESKHARKILDVQGVAEPAAILGARGGELLVKKVKLAKITVAVARLPLQELIKEQNINGA